MFLESAGTDSIRMQGTDIGGRSGPRRVFRMPRMTSRMLVPTIDGEDHEVGDALRQLKSRRAHTVGVEPRGDASKRLW